MAAPMPEGPGALAPIEAEGKLRIRVRLHFGGTFAQDGPRQWRYVGGEVYNESFPLDSKYAEVSKRLNDKFGDTVSFKYLCPGDDVDPDNLVQVQGDDDLLEMCDEYQNALQKPSTPVKTVRIKVFVFRAVIFEREVQELDEELDTDDELMDLPDDGAVGEQLTSGDQEECGPNWSDWGEPEEQVATESSLPSAHLSSDVEVRSGANAAVASAAATAALHNISMSVNSINSGRTFASVTPAVALVDIGTAQQSVPFKVLRTGPYAQASAGQRNPFGGIAPGTMGDGNGVGGEGLALYYDDSSGGYGGGYGQGRGGEAAAMETTFAHSVGAARTDVDAVGLDGAVTQPDARTGPVYMEAGYGEGGFAVSERQIGEAGEEGVRVHLYQDEHQQGQRSLQNAWPGQDRQEGAQTQWRGPAQEDWQGRERVWERNRLHEQERQQSQRQQEQQHKVDQKQERQHLYQRDVMESGLGFYCDEELEDPYRELYDGDAAVAAGAGLYDMRITDAGAGSGRNRSSAASDGAVRVIPRAADVAAYGDHLNEQYGAYAIAAAGGGGSGLLGRLPAVADMLPRHISAFGESSRDDSQSGGSGPYLPSRITIFGDDDSVHGTQGAGGSTAAIRAGGGGGLHRLAVPGASGGAGSAPWPEPSAAFADAAARAGGAYLGAADDMVAGDSRLCITQEFGTQQQSSMLEPGGNHGSGDAAGDGGGGRVSPLDPLDPLMRTGLGVGLGLLGMDGLENLSPASGHNNHPLKGVVKKRKSEVSIMAKIGEGAFGEVSQAQVFPYGIVAIKWLKRERFAKYSESFQREAETLAKLNHPNIIRMYGLVMDTPDTTAFAGGGLSGGGGAPLPHGGSIGGGPGGSGGAGGVSSGSGTPTGLIGGIITEFVRNGSLGQYLRSLGGRRLSLRQRAMIALQAALGMAYLHEQSPAVVHFDLKPDNLLVDGEGDSMVIKVADFGLSKHKLSNYVSCRDLRGTLPYMAYELVSSSGNISEKVDVYSMGVVMWEMYTGEVPFAHLTAQEILTGLLHGNLHLAIPPACEPEWRSLVETCMDPNPANRPSFPELAMQLQEMLRLERQASNASSVSAAAAAAAVAAVLDSSSTLADSGGAGGVQATAGVGAAGVAGGAGGLAQWRMPAPLLAPITPGQPQARSPGAAAPLPQPPPLQPPPPPLLARQQLHGVPPPPLPHHHHHHAPLLAPLAQQLPQPQLPLFQLQQPFGNVPYGMTAAAAQQQAQRHPPPLQPQQPPHLNFAQQLAPGLVLQQPATVSPPHHLVLPLRPPALFQPQQQHAQHMNGLYGLGPGAGGAGLPPLVSWGDRGM